MLGLLALCSLWLSALPLPVISILALSVAAYSGYLIWRELRRESFTLAWAGGYQAATLQFAAGTQSLGELKLSMRGPLATVTGKDDAGRIRRYLWWPDTLSSAARRQLLLADQTRKETKNRTNADKTA
jgi:hypothetical protein